MTTDSNLEKEKMVSNVNNTTMDHKNNYGAISSSSSSNLDRRGILKVQYRQENCWQKFWRKLFPYGFSEEFWEMFAIAWPAILTTFFQFFLQSTSIIMCGHLSKEELDAAALANSIMNVLGVSIGLGLSTACDTLFSQTYGSDNKKRVGMYLQRSLLVMYSFLIVLYCINLNIEPILLFLQQDPVISRMSAQYVLLLMPGLFFDFTYLVLTRYLQNQNIVYPPLIAGLAGNVVNIVSQYLAIYVFNQGYLSSALCQTCSLTVMFLVTLIYILVTRVYEETWAGFSREALYDWGDFIKLAVPGIFLVALEDWSFEISTILAGTLDTVQLGAQSIMFQLEVMTFMIPMGISIAVNIRVGQQLGSLQPNGAVTSYRVGLAMVYMSSIVVAILVITLRDIIPKIFTTEKEIIDLASTLLPLLAAFQFADGTAAISSGAIRGCGRQIQGAILNFIGYYGLALPVGIPLTLLTPLKIYGMWIGLLGGLSVEAIAFMLLVTNLDWSKEVVKAQERAYGKGYDEDVNFPHLEPQSDGHPGPSGVGYSSDFGRFSERTGLIHRPTDEDLITFFSDSELPRHPQPGMKLRKKLYAGRFGVSGDYSRIWEFSHARDLPPFGPVIAKRLVLLVVLLAALTGSVFLRLFLPEPWLLLCLPNNATVGNLTIPLCSNRTHH